MKLTLYARVGNSHERVTKKRGTYIAVEGANYYEVRHSVNGKRVWTNLGNPLDKALIALADEERRSTLRSLGKEAPPVTSTRISVREAVEIYLDLKKDERPGTVAQYENVLGQFADYHFQISSISEITVDHLRKFKDHLKREGYAPKTIDTRLNIVYFLLKKNGVEARIPRDEMPTVDEHPAKPYKPEELDRLFAAMDTEEFLRYQFFLGTACREREVAFASWEDIDWAEGTYHVCSKSDVDFSPKNHEERHVPMPDDLIALLRARYAQPHGRWIFVNEDGKPEGHFLRKFKAIAKRAGLNCGRCKTMIAGKEATCATRPLCEQFYLHRFRKTCATRWAKKLDVRTVQHLLGHKSLATTQIYLGVTGGDELRAKINEAARAAAPKPYVVQRQRAVGGD